MTYLYYRLLYAVADRLLSVNFLSLRTHLRLVELKASSRANLSCLHRNLMIQIDKEVLGSLYNDPTKRNQQ